MYDDAILEAAGFLLRRLSDRSLDQGLSTRETDWYFVLKFCSPVCAELREAWSVPASQVKLRLAKAARSLSEQSGWVRMIPIGIDHDGEIVSRVMVTELGREVLTLGL